MTEDSGKSQLPTVRSRVVCAMAVQGFGEWPEETEHVEPLPRSALCTQVEHLLIYVSAIYLVGALCASSRLLE